MKQLREAIDAIGRRRFLLILLPVLAIAAVEVVTLLLVRLYLQILQGAGGEATGVPAWFGIRDGTAAALWTGLAVTGFLILRAAGLNMLWHRIVSRAAAVQARLTDRLFGAYVGRSLADRQRASGSSDRQTLLLATSTLLHQVLMPALMVVAEGAVALAILAALLVFEPIATVAVVVWLVGLYGGFTALTARHAGRAGLRRWTALEQLRRIGDGALGDPRWVKLTGSEAAFGRLHAEAAAEHGRAAALAHTLALSPRYLIEIAMISTLLLLTAIFLAEGRGGAALLTHLMLFAAASVRLLPAAQRIIALVHGLRAHAPDLERVLGDLALPSDVPEAEARPGDAPPFRQAMRVEDLGFGYGGGVLPVLHGVSFELRAGERLVLSGPSGTGKSTLLSLMLGLLTPTAGRITLDGEAVPLLARMRASSVALVPQDPFTLDGTLAANIAFPEPPETLDRDFAVELLAELGLAGGLDSPAGEGGRMMSGGERQRLAVARALYRRPALLVLDEATSQLDVGAEAAVFRAIERHCPEATILMVAHRPVPESFGARAVRLDRGRLKEEATV